MCNFNYVQLIGNLGRNPEKVEPKKGASAQKGIFVKMSLATNKKYKDTKGELVTDTQWHTVYLNNKAADFALSTLNTGDKVLIIGELRHNKWTDKNGVVRYSTAVHARDCRAFFNKSETETETEDQAAREASEGVSDVTDTHDDIPF